MGKKYKIKKHQSPVVFVNVPICTISTRFEAATQNPNIFFFLPF
jgi:hypothetical protein